MSYSVLFTVLPAGFPAPGTARVTVVASPRPQPGQATLDGSPLLNWPAIVAGLDVRLAVDGQPPRLVEVTRVGDPPSTDLWQALFPAPTRVRARGRGASALSRISPGRRFVDAANSITEVYAQAGSHPTSALPPGHAVTRLLDAVVEAEDTIPDLSRVERVSAAAERLRAEGRDDLVAALPIASFAASLRNAAAGARPARATSAVTPLAGIGRVDDADFHQVVGLLLAHPVLARALGLVFDLDVPAFSGERSIRLAGPDGQPLNGPIARSQPWSRVVADPASRRFTMAPAPTPGREIVGGMLAASPDPVTSRHLVTDVDVAGLSLQLAGLANRRAATVADDDGAVRLPVPHDVGITVAQADRFESVVTYAVDRGEELERTVAREPADGDDPVLFADDVTTGYRIDVSTDGGPFRSLMRRNVAYRVGDHVLTADDEGKVEAITAVQQAEPDGTVLLRASEQMFTWNGWCLSAPKPGRSALGVAVDGETTAPVASQPAPGYDLRIDVTAAPGTVPPLRFGKTFQFRGRGVDLAGASIDPELCDPVQVLPPIRYTRSEAAPSPVRVPRARFDEGQSLDRLVVRSSGTGEVIGRPCERHLLPPKGAQHLAEQHGMFDAAMGPNAAAEVVAALLQIARREAGSITDPAPGLSFVTSNPADPPLTALPPRGEPLPNGYYAVHAGDDVRVSYLPDPAVAGASLIGMPGAIAPTVATFTGGAWPDLRPALLRVVPTTVGTKPSARVVREDGRDVLIVSVPPGLTLHLELASAIAEAMLDQMAPTRAPRADALNGQVLALSARQPLTIVHAVRQPLAAPVLRAAPGVSAGPHATSIAFTAEVDVHRPTTGRVDVQARWTEVVDTGEGDAVRTDRHASVGSSLVDPKDPVGPVLVVGTQVFADTKHRRVEYVPVATTQFREYFTVPDGDPSIQRAGAPIAISIPNRARPPRPEVHSIVPAFRWQRSTNPVTNTYTSTRRTTGVRVYLRHRWFETGDGEQLGVVVSTTADDAIQSIDPEDPKAKQDYVSQWGSDPLQELQDKVWVPMVADDVPGPNGGVTVPLTEPSANDSPDVTIVGHPVHFDAERDLWYADVDLDIGDTPWPFVRLGLVRFQPESVEDCHVSRVTMTDFVQLPPRRTLTASKLGKAGVRARIEGTATRNSSFVIRQERRIPDALDPTLELGSDAGLGAGWQITSQPSSSALAVIDLNRIAGAGPLGTLLPQLRAGRVVVEEHEAGFTVLGASTPTGDRTTTRVVWTEVFDRALIGIEEITS